RPGARSGEGRAPRRPAPAAGRPGAGLQRNLRRPQPSGSPGAARSKGRSAHRAQPLHAVGARRGAAGRATPAQGAAGRRNDRVRPPEQPDRPLGPCSAGGPDRSLGKDHSLSSDSLPGVAASQPGEKTFIQFDDNALLPLLYGEHDQNLLRIEQQLGVSLASRGNRLAITGPAESVEAANAALTALYQRLKKGLEVGDGEVDAVVRMALQSSDSVSGHEAVRAVHSDELSIATRKRRLTPRSPGQKVYIQALR